MYCTEYFPDVVFYSATIGQAVHQLLLIQAFRLDRLLAMSHIFVAKVLGETFMNIIEQPLDLANIVDSEVRLNVVVSQEAVLLFRNWVFFCFLIADATAAALVSR